MEAIRQSAEEQWTAEAAAYAAQKKQNQSADDKWIYEVIQSGTLSDKIAALTLLVQQSPIHNSQLLDNLVGMATKKERRVMEMAIKALKDLLINDLLPDRRLVRFEQRLQQAGTKELSPREAILYIFEDHLKLKYGELLRALEEGMKDTVEAHRRFCLDVCFDLLANKPEKEDVLLKLIVNKLGDPMKKIAARALELLGKLTRRHGAMVEAIVEEVQQFLQRPNLGARATFNAVIFLSSIRFTQTAQGARAAEKVIGIYFTLFEQVNSCVWNPPGLVCLECQHDADCAWCGFCRTSRARRTRRRSSPRC
jgi:ribosome biogenesis protein MAK21